jgi:ribosomal protein L4
MSPVEVLLITAEKQEMVYLSARNLENVKLITASNLNVYDMSGGRPAGCDRDGC